jgi:hypothetical protein
MINYQEELDYAYDAYLKAILKKDGIIDLIENDQISSPQIIDVTAPDGNYVNADYKILFVGQETKGWLNPFPKESLKLSKDNTQAYIDTLKSCYREFNFSNMSSGRKYNGTFNNYVNNILVHFPKDKIGYLTTNLYKHDERQKRIKSKNFKLIKEENYKLLKEEIKILKPNAIIFFTGHALDYKIKRILGKGISFNTIESIQSVKQFATITSPDHSMEIFRTYHPGYLKWKINNQPFVKLLLAHIVKSIGLKIK